MSAKNNRRGATVVEFAMVLPVLLLVVFGTIEMSRVSMLRHSANHAAYTAARDGIVPGATAADAIAAAEEHLNVLGIKGGVIEIVPSTITEGTSLIGVTVTFPVAANSFVVPEFMSGSVVGRSAMITERSRGQMSTSLPEPPAPPLPPTPITPPTTTPPPTTPPPTTPPPTPQPPTPPATPPPPAPPTPVL